MLFPQLGNPYYNENHKGILSRMEAAYAESITINQSQWAEADTDLRFYTGDQTMWNDLYGNLPANRRRNFNFNRVRRVVDMVSGHQRRNRKSTICTPVENGDAETADQFTKILLWINNQEGVLDTISEAFQGSLITGMNFLQLWMDYREDPISGNIKVDNCAYNSFLVDPYMRKQDMSDCNYIWKRSYLTKRECVALLPEYTDEVLSLWGHDNRDGKFQYMPESYNYGLKNLLTYDEYYYRDYRSQKMLVDTNTGETMEWKSSSEDRLREFLNVYPSVTVIDQEIPTVRLAIVVQNKVLYDGPQPMGIDSYPFVPVLTYYHPESPYWPFRVQGMVRGLRDAQYLYNRRRVIELDILESQINSGYIYKENALVNPRDVFLSGQGKGLALKSDANMTDVMQIQAPQIPPSMIQLSELLAKEIQEVAGVSDELLGFDNKDTLSGYHAMLKQSASTTTLQCVFDLLDKSQKLLGKKMIELIQANFTPGKVKKILEGEEPMQQFYSKAFGKYHCVVEEGLNTSTQQQMQMAQMLMLREAGVPITNEDLLEASTVQGKKKIVENMQQQQQQQAQMQQQQMQAAMQEQQARTELAQARAEADRGLGVERTSRVQENQALAVERRAAAIKDQEIGLLNLVKALKEIDTVDLEHVEKLMALERGLRDQEILGSQPVVRENKNNPTQNSSVAGS